MLEHRLILSGQEQLSGAWGWERAESGRWIAEGVRKLWEVKGLFNIIIVMVASFHLHVHVIPRYEGDSVNIKWVPHEDIDIDAVYNELWKEVKSD